MELTVNVKLDLSGFKPIEKACEVLNTDINVGILHNPAEAEIGALQHYGGVGTYSYGKYEGQEVRIPPRPFLAEAMEHNGAEIVKSSVGKLDKFTPQNAEKVLDEIGAKAVTAVQDRIDQYAAAGGNSPRTVETKGKDSPLIDKGNLRASIEYEVAK